MKFFAVFLLIAGLSLYPAQYFDKWYNTDNGLPQNSVNDIIKDKYGFIWLSTEKGIVRYDGSQFLLYDTNRMSNLGFGDFFGNIAKDSIVNYNNYEDSRIVISKRNVQIRQTAKIPHKILFINNKKYVKYHKTRLIPIFFKDINCYFLETDSGTYYFNEEYVEYEDKTDKKRIKLNLKFKHSDLMHVFGDGDIVFFSDMANKRVLKIEKGKISRIEAPSIFTDPETKFYWHQLTKQILVIHKDNIYWVKFVNNKFILHFLVTYPEIKRNSFYSMFYDENFNKLYIGSMTKGLDVVTLSNFYVSKKNTPYADEIYYAALPVGKNSIVTEEGIKYYRDRSEKIFSSKGSPDKLHLLYDDSGNIVYKRHNSIFKRDPKNNFKLDSLTFKDNIQALFRSKGLYTGAFIDGKGIRSLYVFENDQFKKIKNKIRFNSYIFSVYKYSEDLVYVCTSDGLYVVSMQHNKVVKKIVKGISVKYIIKTSDGNLWFTTHKNGFYLLDNDKAVRMPYDANGFISSAHYITEDRESNFWITTNNGLFKVNKYQLLQFARDLKSKVTYYRYTKEYGFLNNEFNGGGSPCATVLEDEEFVFPSMEGFLFFKPKEIKSYFPESNQIFLERARVNNRNIAFQNTLILKSDYKNIDIWIDIPYYYNVENIYIEAKLMNSDHAKWEKINPSKNYRINDIPPGKYTLIVRFLASKNGNFSYKTMEIEIQPLFYQTVIFKVLIVLLGTIILFLIIRLRTNRLNTELKKKNTQLDITQQKLENEAEYQKKIIETIGHDVTTPIKYLVDLSKNLSETDDAELQKKYFDSIYRSSEEIYKFALNLKEYSNLYRAEKKNEDSLYIINDLLNVKVALFQEIALQNQTEIINISSQNIQTNVNRSILTVIIHNILDNAVKNTQSGEVIVDANEYDELIIIRISDSGKGISQEQIEYYTELFENMPQEQLPLKKYGLGLNVVLHLVKKIEGHIFFRKNKPTGTIVEIKIKTKL